MKRTKDEIETLYVAYYRVSTRKQGASGLGLDAQKETVRQFIKRNGNKIIAEFTEVESGKNNDRPQLNEAIEFAKENNATLVIAKLDRLSRNVSFISKLMDEKVKFVACDLPQANELTIHIFASMAEFERKRISERVKDALRAKREREPDWKPGPTNPNTASIDLAHAANSRKAREAVENRKAYHYAKSLRERGKSFAEIAYHLNKERYRTRRGNRFHPAQVRLLFKYFETETNQEQ